MNLSKITRPTLLLDAARARRNIARMVERTKQQDVRFRPHFKTHQSSTIGAWFRAFGVEAITVSSVRMAACFAAHGWDDINIAFPANLREVEAIDRLAADVRLHLLVDEVDTVETFRDRLRHPASIWIDIDVGEHRTGIPWDDGAAIARVATAVRPPLRFGGLLTHAGHTYHASTPAEIRGIHRETVDRMGSARDRLAADCNGPIEISIGDTPGCTLTEPLGPIDEIRPGNLVFHDLVQQRLGVCGEDDLALALACPVVAKDAQRRRLVIYGAAIHLSKDALPGPNGRPIYGIATTLDETGWGPLRPACAVSALSQEVGLVETDDLLWNAVEVGDLVAVAPVHACLTVAAMRAYVTLDGETISADCG